MYSDKQLFIYCSQSEIRFKKNGLAINLLMWLSFGFCVGEWGNHKIG